MDQPSTISSSPFGPTYCSPSEIRASFSTDLRCLGSDVNTWATIRCWGSAAILATYSDSHCHSVSGRADFIDACNSSISHSCVFIAQIPRVHDRFQLFILSRKGAESQSGFLGVLAALRETILSHKGSLASNNGFASQLLRGFVVHPPACFKRLK